VKHVLLKNKDKNIKGIRLKLASKIWLKNKFKYVKRKKFL
jgi:hypothetical protein